LKGFTDRAVAQCYRGTAVRGGDVRPRRRRQDRDLARRPEGAATGGS
jgi:hypothetical protein